MTENISFTRISDLPDMSNGPPMMGEISNH